MRRLPQVSIRDLSRSPATALRRVRQGERLIVVRHKDPLATLQPLDGYVFQPFTGTAHDIFGWPIGGMHEEIAKLTLAQQLLLRDCYRDWRLWSRNLPDDLRIEWHDALSDLILRGLAKRTPRGWELTGRGLAVHEALQREVA